MPSASAGAYLPLVEVARAQRAVARLHAAAVLAAALPAQDPAAAPPGTPQQPERPSGPGLLPPAASPVFHSERNTGTALLQQHRGYSL